MPAVSPFQNSQFLSLCNNNPPAFTFHTVNTDQSKLSIPVQYSDNTHPSRAVSSRVGWEERSSNSSQYMSRWDKPICSRQSDKQTPRSSDRATRRRKEIEVSSSEDEEEVRSWHDEPLSLDKRPLPSAQSSSQPTTHKSSPSNYRPTHKPIKLDEDSSSDASAPSDTSASNLDLVDAIQNSLHDVEIPDKDEDDQTTEPAKALDKESTRCDQALMSVGSSELQKLMNQNLPRPETSQRKERWAYSLYIKFCTAAKADHHFPLDVKTVAGFLRFLALYAH